MGHTKGDTIAWIPSQKICFSGDLVEYGAAAYTGDAQLEEWPATLEALRALGAEKLVPGPRPGAGESGTGQRRASTTPRTSSPRCSAARRKRWPAQMTLKEAMAHVRSKMDPKFSHVFIYEHCLPFDVTRACDEAKRHQAPAHLDRGARQGNVARLQD
jgi:glyoxylase-like metal-dependent hydrolase (beta-lactamase superfamily II)